jgi:hypothetical protein
MYIPEEKDWKNLILSAVTSRKEAQFFVSPEIPPRVFTNCIKSYAKYVTSQGEKILALFDSGRGGKEGLALTETGLSFRDAYGNFGGLPYETIISFDTGKSGDPEHPFPLMTIHGCDGTVCTVSFMENPTAVPILEELMRLIVEENDKPGAEQKNGFIRLTLKEQWLELIEHYLPHIPMEGLFKRPYIPEKQLSVAIESYGRDLLSTPEAIVALFDYKTFGSEGFLLTTGGLMYNLGYENWGFLAYESINSIDYAVQRILNSDVPSLTISTRDGQLVELQFIIHPAVALHLFSIIDKGVLFNQTRVPEEETAVDMTMAGVIDQFLPHDPANRIYKSPSIAPEVMQIFRSTFPEAFAREPEKVRALYDNSRKESGESGCVLGDTALYLRNNRKKVEILPYKKILAFEIDSGRHHNDILFYDSEGSVHTLSFYLYKKAQDEFLHFLRQAFPGKERVTQTTKAESRSLPSKKYLSVSKRTISSFAPPELTILVVLCSLLLLLPPRPSPSLFLFSLAWFFSLSLFGFALASSRNDYFRTRAILDKCPSILNREAPEREKELVITKGKIQAGPYVLENGTLYQEQEEREEHPSLLTRLLSRFRKQVLLRSVPFYLDDGTGKLLVILQDGDVAVSFRKEQSLDPDDTVYICATVTRNPYSRDFPDSDYALMRIQRGENTVFLASDTESGLGISAHERLLTFFEIAAGWICVSLGLIGSISYFFLKEVAHQRGFELIVNLFR